MRALILSALTCFIVSCASAGPKDSYEEVLAGKAVIIDVRENDEVKNGMIDQAAWIPLSKMESTPAETTEEVRSLAGGKTIYVYCRSGRRSQIFLDKLKEGQVSGVNLGGYEDLLKAGLPKKP